VVQQSVQASSGEWYQSVIAQLGAGGVFALAIIYIVLKFVRLKRNGGSVMDYLKTSIEPRLHELHEDHGKLMEKVAKLPTRDEMKTNIKEHIKDHERAFHPPK